MVPNPDNRSGPGSPAAGVLLRVLPLCCGVPLLISTGTLATVAAILTDPWVIAIAGALLAAVLWRTTARRIRPSSDIRAPQLHATDDAAITPCRLTFTLG